MTDSPRSRRDRILSVAVHKTLYPKEAREKGEHWPVLNSEVWIGMLAIQVDRGSAPSLGGMVKVVRQASRATDSSYKTQQERAVTSRSEQGV